MYKKRSQCLIPQPRASAEERVALLLLPKDILVLISWYLRTPLDLGGFRLCCQWVARCIPPDRMRDMWEVARNTEIGEKYVEVISKCSKCSMLVSGNDTSRTSICWLAERDYFRGLEAIRENLLEVYTPENCEDDDALVEMWRAVVDRKNWTHRHSGGMRFNFISTPVFWPRSSKPLGICCENNAYCKACQNNIELQIKVYVGKKLQRSLLPPPREDAREIVEEKSTKRRKMVLY